MAVQPADSSLSLQPAPSRAVSPGGLVVTGGIRVGLFMPKAVGLLFKSEAASWGASFRVIPTAHICPAERFKATVVCKYQRQLIGVQRSLTVCHFNLSC